MIHHFNGFSCILPLLVAVSIAALFAASGCRLAGQNPCVVQFYPNETMRVRAMSQSKDKQRQKCSVGCSMLTHLCSPHSYPVQHGITFIVW
jgi:hypothetical protein